MTRPYRRRGFASRLGRLRDEDGLTMIEVLVAASVLLIGLVGAFEGIISSNRAVTAGERYAAMEQVGEQALQAAQSLPYASIADSSAPTQTSTTNTTNPTSYLSANCTGGSCYQWNPSSSSSIEPLAVSTTNGKVAPGPTSVVVPSPTTGCTTTATTNCQMTFSVYTFVTDSTDAVCSQSGVTCPSTTSYKRITVAVVNAGTGAPFDPLYLSAFVGYDAGGSSNPLTSGSTTCLDGTTSVPCVK
jgi:Tfp pilus assembly protein PilV